MYDCYRKRACARGLGSLKWIDFQIILAICIIIAVIICVVNKFIYGIIGISMLLLGDSTWFIIRDIEHLAGLDAVISETGIAPNDVV